jgi:hypothetical protein
MTEKTLFEVLLPATAKTYEFWVPQGVTVNDARNLIAGILADKEPSFFKPNAQTALYDMDTGDELNINAYISSFGYTNGAKLMLV